LPGNLIEFSLKYWRFKTSLWFISRLTIEDVGCEKLLAHRSVEKILQKLAVSLGCDNAGSI
jgi:hypothetical protein